MTHGGTSTHLRVYIFSKNHYVYDVLTYMGIKFEILVMYRSFFLRITGDIPPKSYTLYEYNFSEITIKCLYRRKLFRVYFRYNHTVIYDRLLVSGVVILKITSCTVTFLKSHHVQEVYSKNLT